MPFDGATASPPLAVSPLYFTLFCTLRRRFAAAIFRVDAALLFIFDATPLFHAAAADILSRLRAAVFADAPF